MTDELNSIKIAENKDVATWTKIREDVIKEIDANKRAILINERILQLAEEKIQEYKAKDC